jgi:histone H3/H4
MQMLHQIHFQRIDKKVQSQKVGFKWAFALQIILQKFLYLLISKAVNFAFRVAGE